MQKTDVPAPMASISWRLVAPCGRLSVITKAAELVKIFDRPAIKAATGDVFSRIYE